MLKRVLIFLLSGLMLYVMCTTDHVAGGTETTNNKVGYKGLYGKLVDSEGKEVFGVTVKAIIIDSASLSPKKTSATKEAYSSDTETVFTDDSGYYSFEQLNVGIYNLLGDYKQGSLVVLIAGIEYDSTGKVQEVATDTLRAPGQISGRVNTGTEENGGVMCYIPGTSFIAITNDTGEFMLSDIPQGRYTLSYRMDKLKTETDTGIEVRSGEKTVLSTKNMEFDAAYPPPVPKEITVSYDTLNGSVHLSWSPVAVADLAGYVVYRNDTSLSLPERLNEKLIDDTVYVDEVFSDHLDTAYHVYTYRVKSQDDDANLSTVYSKSATIQAVSPTLVRTFISLKLLNTHNDTASINDMVKIVASYRNNTRENVKLEWFSGDSSVRVVIDTTRSGEDTLQISWSHSSIKNLFVATTDVGGTVWRDSMTVSIVQDIPVVDAGKDTVVTVNDTVWLHGSATQKFGEILKWEWKIGSGIWNETGGMDTFFVAPSEEKTVICSLAVTDDDSNRAAAKVAISSKILIANLSYNWILKEDYTLWEFTGLEDTPIWVASDVKSMDAGSHGLILKNDNTLWACGLNDSGQLGDGTTISRIEPVKILSEVINFSVGSSHSLIVKSNGTLWACGSNNSGQLGDGTTTNRLLPVQVMDDVQGVSAGRDYSLILKKDNTMWACGDNTFGQLGDGTNLNRFNPIQVMSDVISMSAGSRSTLAITTDNWQWGCGDNVNGQLGDRIMSRTTPEKIVSNIKSVWAGDWICLALKMDKTLWVYGRYYTNLKGSIATDVECMTITSRKLRFLKTDNTLWEYTFIENGNYSSESPPKQIILPEMRP